MIDKIIVGHVLDELKKIPDNFVHCCVTSPPYWGLRDYGLEPKVWGAESVCEHDFDKRAARAKGGQQDYSSSGLKRDGRTEDRRIATLANHQTRGDPISSFHGFCRLCGAWRGSLGLEPTYKLYIQHLVEIFREVRRVLRADGTCWLNLGDSYNAAGRDGHGIREGFKQGTNRASANAVDSVRSTAGNLKPKDLVGIPWRVALALQADGWYLRRDIIWHKPNPMPESVKDRPTTAHEYIFLFAKNENYYYDADKISEPSKYAGEFVVLGPKSLSRGQALGVGVKPSENALVDTVQVGSRRNKRSVWSITTQSFPEAHFATFPLEIPHLAISAGVPEEGIVLDPFFGSGTTGLAAKINNRHFIGIELNPEYAKMAERRLAGVNQRRIKNSFEGNGLLEGLL